MLEIENEKFENERRAKDEKIDNLESEATCLNEKLVILKIDFEAKATVGQEAQARLKEQLMDLSGEMLALKKKRKQIWIENMEEETRKRRDSILEKRKRATNLKKVEEEGASRRQIVDTVRETGKTDGTFVKEGGAVSREGSSTSQPVRSSNLQQHEMALGPLAGQMGGLMPYGVTSPGDSLDPRENLDKYAPGKTNRPKGVRRGLMIMDDENRVSLKVTGVELDRLNQKQNSATTEQQKFGSGGSNHEIPDLMRVKSTIAEKDDFLDVAENCKDKIRDYNKKMYQIYSGQNKGSVFILYVY